MIEDFEEALESVGDTSLMLQLLFDKSGLDIDKAGKTRIEDAWQYLCAHTSNIKRSCGEAYCMHPLRVAFILATNHLDTDCIIAGLFHNVLEPCILDDKTRSEIKSRFGGTVYKIIAETARITSLRIKNKTLQEADAIRKMLFAMVDDVRVILVKLADRLDRMRHLKAVSLKSQRAVAHEVIDIWAPLAGRLGMSDVKSELEDLSLKYTNPDVFLQIKSIVAQKKAERADYLDRVKAKIEEAASAQGIEITVTSRAKHFYSIYQKMRKRGKSAAELYDLLAVRIICNTVGECYTLIGIVHGLWTPMEGRFKDYIAMPKSNGYQSLHTTVICDGTPLEIQIRTKDMHFVAEHGVASHWLYKKGTNHDLVNIESLSIINQLRALRSEGLDDETLFNEIKGDLLGDEIFVFTPKGDVIELPQGANAIDFAYHIHSDVGQKIVGAKADGKIIPLSMPLKNTQIIEVMTNQGAHPTVNQLNTVRTSKAKAKIRAYLVAHDPTFDSSPVAHEVPPARGGTKETISPHKKGTNKDQPPSPVVPQATGKIKIAGETNFLVGIAGCCRPKYPDPIVGYISRGRGVIVHRADCRTFYRIPNIDERTIEVSWDTTNKK